MSLTSSQRALLGLPVGLMLVAAVAWVLSEPSEVPPPRIDSGGPRADDRPQPDDRDLGSASDRTDAPGSGAEGGGSVGEVVTDPGPEGGGEPAAGEFEGASRVRGVVVTLDGEPVSAATVSASEPQSGRVLASGRCDVGGRFRLEGLGPGSYLVTASAPGHGRAAEVVELPLGSELRFALEQVRVVRGTVVRRGGGPVGAGVGVRVDGKQWAFTDGEGAFVLEGLDVDVPLRLSALGQGLVSAEPLVLEVGSADVDGLELAVIEGLTLEVEVRGEGTLLEGVNLRVIGEERGEPRAYGQTTAQGLATLTGLRRGSQLLVVSADDWLDQELEVSLSAPVTRLPVELGRGARVEGRVVSGGTPVEGARFGLAQVTSDGEQPEDEMRTAESGTDGAYRFSGLEAGTYRLRLYAQTSDRGRRTVTLLETTTVAAAEAMTVDVRLPTADEQGSIAGQVRGAGPGYRVEVWQHSEEGVEQTRTVTWTDDAGRYRIDGLSAGSYDLRAGEAEPLRVTVTAGQVVETNLEAQD